MIYGIGTDIVLRSRIEGVYARHGERFVHKILGDDEYKIFQRRHLANPARGILFLATRFAAKEAFSKAIGLGMRMPMTWRRAQFIKHPSGQPFVKTDGELAQFVALKKLHFHVSMSDEADYVTAFVVAETIDA